VVHPFRYGPTTLDGPPFVHLLTEKSPEKVDPKIHCPDLVRKKRTMSGPFSGISHGMHGGVSYVHEPLTHCSCNVPQITTLYVRDCHNLDTNS
jgi:hypothetical protein